MNLIRKFFTWTRVHQVEPPDVRRDAGLLSVVAEDADAATLRELVVLVIEVLGRHQMVYHGPSFASSDQGGREDDTKKFDCICYLLRKEQLILWMHTNM